MIPWITSAEVKFIILILVWSFGFIGTAKLEKAFIVIGFRFMFLISSSAPSFEKSAYLIISSKFFIDLTLWQLFLVMLFSWELGWVSTLLQSFFPMISLSSKYLIRWEVILCSGLTASVPFKIYFETSPNNSKLIGGYSEVESVWKYCLMGRLLSKVVFIKSS